MSSKMDFIKSLNQQNQEPDDQEEYEEVEDHEEVHEEDDSIDIDHAFLIKKGYPKKKTFSGDVVIHEDEHGDEYEYIYFNIGKWLKKHKLYWIYDNDTLFSVLDKMFYGRSFIDNMAAKSYDKVQEYNEMDSYEQYSYDTRIKKIRYSILGGFIVIILSLTFFSWVPNHQVNKAKRNLKSGDYVAANSYYKNKDGDLSFFKHFTDSYVFLKNGKLDEAEESMENAMQLKSQAHPFDYNEGYNKFLYELGKAHIENDDVYSAARVMKPLRSVSKYRNDYFKTAYEASEKYYQSAQYGEAFETLGGILGYEDTEERLEEMARSLYQEGMNLYKNKQYNQSRESFSSLSVINYANSRTMKTQVDYIVGLDAYKQKEFNRAEEIFLEIPEFKDSAALLRDITYRRGLLLFKDKPAEAYPHIYFSANYQDANKLLTHPTLALYGVWTIEKEGQLLEDQETIEFNLNNQFILNDADIPLSEGVVYTYSGSKYRDPDGTSEFELEVIDPHRVVIKKDGNEYHLMKLRVVDEVLFKENNLSSTKKMINDRINELIDSNFKTQERDLEKEVEEVNEENEKEDIDE